METPETAVTRLSISGAEIPLTEMEALEARCVEMGVSFDATVAVMCRMASELATGDLVVPDVGLLRR